MGKKEHRPYKDLTVEQLCERFDGDILYDMHSLTARIERSLARRELLERGRSALAVVIAHIELHPKLTGRESELPALLEELRLAWMKVLNSFEIRLDPKRGAPQKLADTPGWLAWAKTQTA